MMEEKSVCSKLRHGEDGGRRVADINREEGGHDPAQWMRRFLYLILYKYLHFYFNAERDKHLCHVDVTRSVKEEKYLASCRD